jgi:DNA-binding HxlR family transcriptional regulator
MRTLRVNGHVTVTDATKEGVRFLGTFPQGEWVVLSEKRLAQAVGRLVQGIRPCVERAPHPDIPTRNVYRLSAAGWALLKRIQEAEVRTP